MSDRADPRPVVAHTVIPWLPKSGSWIHSQIAGLSRYRAIGLTKRLENRATFPFEPVYSTSELPPLARIKNRVGKRRLGYFPLWREKLEEHGARLIHSHFGNWAYEDVALKRALGLPQISSFYGADAWKLGKDPRWRERYRELFDAGELFLVEGSAMRARLIELGCPPEKVRVHHLGVDLDKIAFRRRELGRDGVVRFLAAGRMIGTKGHDLAVRAFAIVQRELPNSHLGLILIPPEHDVEHAFEPVHRAIREAGAGSAITLHGYMPYPEYLAALESHHVFLQPSRHVADGGAEGGAPVAMTEMSASGMPVIGSIHCDIPEVILHEESGLLFEENDVEGLAQAMLKIARAPERWGDFGAAGRAHVEREYNARRQAPRLEAIYDELLGTAPPALPALARTQRLAST